MRKSLELDDIYINISDFPNPNSHQNSGSLPKIHNQIRHRVYSNKIKFYQMVDKSFKRKQPKNNEDMGLRLKRTGNKLRTLKSESSVQTDGSKYLQLSLSKQKLKRQPNKELINSRRLKDQTDQSPSSSLRKKTNSDDQPKQKMKFNMLRLEPVINYSQSKHGGKPETLAQLMNGKMDKVEAVNNPLVNLYKKKSQKHIFNRYQQLIKEEDSEAGSSEKSTKRQLIPKQLIRNFKFRKQENELKLQSSFEQKVKGWMNSPQITKKKIDNATEFSRKINEDSFQKISKVIPIGENHKFKLPNRDQYKQFINNYQNMNPSFNLNTVTDKQNFRIVATDKSVYFGQFSDNMHGYGVLVTPESVFQGYFEKGFMLNGNQLNYDGVYSGEYSNNLREGKGRFEWNNGQIYEGEWKAGKRQGFGIWRNSNSDSYEGQWVKGRQQGQGTRKQKSNIYKGELVNGYKNGKGEQYFQNGDHYQGTYLQGKPHGFGRYDWRDGSYYEGEFINGYREGKGELHEKNGCMYKGSFRRDFKHGMGQQILQSGQKIAGEFKDGELAYEIDSQT